MEPWDPKTEFTWMITELRKFLKDADERTSFLFRRHLIYPEVYEIHLNGKVQVVNRHQILQRWSAGENTLSQYCKRLLQDMRGKHYGEVPKDELPPSYYRPIDLYWETYRVLRRIMMKAFPDYMGRNSFRPVIRDGQEIWPAFTAKQNSLTVPQLRWLNEAMEEFITARLSVEGRASAKRYRPQDDMARAKMRRRVDRRTKVIKALAKAKEENNGASLQGEGPPREKAPECQTTEHLKETPTEPLIPQPAQ